MHVFFEVAPGVVLVWVLVTAARPAQVILRDSRRGRARSAIAYLSGLFAGLGTAILLFVALETFLEDPPEIGAIGLFAAFVGPFAGMLRAKWPRPVRRREQRRSPSPSLLAARGIGRLHP